MTETEFRNAERKLGRIKKKESDVQCVEFVKSRKNGTEVSLHTNGQWVRLDYDETQFICDYLITKRGAELNALQKEFDEL